MIHAPHRSRTLRRGAIAVEAALVLPILLILAFGVIEFGHYYFLSHTLKGAAQCGARAAIPNGLKDDANARAQISQIMTAGNLGSSGYTVTISPPLTSANKGDNITVTVECNWGTVGIRPLGLLAASKQIKGVAIMQKE